MKLYIFIHILCKFKECPPFTFNNLTNIYKYINGMIDVNQLTYMKTHVWVRQVLIMEDTNCTLRVQSSINRF